MSTRIIQWLRECCREDRMRQAIIDFTSRKVQSIRFFSGVEELADGAHPSRTLPLAAATRMDTVLREYRREREAVYGCLFLVGKAQLGDADTRTWCAPLILYPASLESGTGSRMTGQVSIDLKRWRINPALHEVAALPDDFGACLESLLPDGRLTSIAVAAIADLLSAIAGDTGGIGIDTTPATEYPVLVRAKVVRARRTEPGLALMPASALGIVQRGRSVRGLLDELSTLASSDEQWSPPLRLLLEGGGSEVPGKSQGTNHASMRHWIPAILSPAQSRILDAAHHADLTLCHGPPGTGKSFTIAALVVDHVLRGKSVLVASRSNHAVDVVDQKIHELLGGDFMTVRAGRRGYLLKMKVFLHDYLSGAITADAPDWKAVASRQLELQRVIELTSSREAWLEKELETALAHGEVIASQRPGWLPKLHRKWIEMRVAKRPLLATLVQMLEATHLERIAEARESLRLDRLLKLVETLDDHGTREQLRRLRSVLVRRRSSHQLAAMSLLDANRIAKIFPVWLVNLTDLHRVLPLEPALFDLVVIDEASQCDLASVLPALARGRRAVIAGDQRQLRHVSFVSRLRMDAVATRLSVDTEARRFFDYRQRSAIDAAADRVETQKHVGFLNEHFRSRKAIIAFSNERFYSGRLTVMKERPWDEHNRVLTWRRCSGRRGKDGKNRGEVEAVIKCLKQLVVQQDGMPPRSIGVLSPFRPQIDAIRAAIRAEGAAFDRALLENHRLRLGTAHSFQGEERDVMLLSFAIDPTTPASVLRFLERHDVFNVSITRAKSRQIVFTSLDGDDLPDGSLLGAYLYHLDQPIAESSAVGREIEDRFAGEVEAALRNAGCKVLRGVTIAGVMIDLLATRDGDVLGIDLVGHPGEMRGAVELARQKILSRAGFRLLPVGFAEWRTRPIDVTSELLLALLRGAPENN